MNARNITVPTALSSAHITGVLLIHLPDFPLYQLDQVDPEYQVVPIG